MIPWINEEKKKKKKVVFIQDQISWNTSNAEILSMVVLVEWMIFKTSP